MISFITPYRNRSEQLEGFINNIDVLFQDKEYEIVCVVQDDDRAFNRGQLFNLGFKKSKGDIIVLEDIDIRFFESIDFAAELHKHGSPMLPYTHISQIEEPELGKYHILKTEVRPNCGGVCFMKREQFETSNGFSNLAIGWGGEDDLFNDRVHLRRVHNRVGHVSHDPTKGDDELVWARYLKNMDLWRSGFSRDPSSDSFHHTIATELGSTNYQGREDIVVHRFRDITVPEDFAYKDLLEGREEMTVDDIKASLEYRPYYPFELDAEPYSPLDFDDAPYAPFRS